MTTRAAENSGTKDKSFWRRKTPQGGSRAVFKLAPISKTDPLNREKVGEVAVPQESLNAPWFAGLALLLILLIVEFSRYKQLQYFNFTDAKFKFHYLTTKYKLDRKQGEIDLKKLNLAVFLSALAAMLVSGIVLVCTSWNMILSFGVYIILKDIFRRIVFRQVGKKYGDCTN